jgi:hypothetical protein
MKSLWNAADAAEIRNRIQKLSPSAKRQWGTMSVSQMQRHMVIAFQAATGEMTLKSDPLQVLASLGIMRKIIIEWMPWPKSLPTAKDFIVSSDPDFDATHAAFTKVFEEFVSKNSSSAFGSHPLFGKMPYQQWGQLMYKHTDHHLKQFGV